MKISVSFTFKCQLCFDALHLILLISMNFELNIWTEKIAKLYFGWKNLFIWNFSIIKKKEKKKNLLSFVVFLTFIF